MNFFTGKGETTLTGLELIRHLTSLNDSDLNKEVILEGCDCFGTCSDVKVSERDWEQTTVIMLVRGEEV